MEPKHEMTPESHIPGNPERFTPESAGLEQQETPQPLTPEQTPSRQESREQVSGRGAGDSASAQALPTPVMPQPIQPPAQDDTATSATQSSAKDDPLTADDVDVIEKEWVDRAKKILADTKNDPYQKEYEVSRLQADYLEKRFGVQVKLPQG